MIVVGLMLLATFFLSACVSANVVVRELTLTNNKKQKKRWVIYITQREVHQ